MNCVDSIVVSLFAIVILSTIGALFQVCHTESYSASKATR